MRMTVLATVAALTLGAAIPDATAQEAPDPWEQRYTNGIAAVVEDRIITLEQLRQEMRPLVPEVRRRARGDRGEFERLLDELARDILQNLIDRILIVQEFREDKYQLPQAYIENEFDNYIIENFEGDRAAFLESLRAQGKTVREFRRELEENIIVSFMRSRMRKSESYVSPVKIRERYQENAAQFRQEEAVKLRQIVLSPIAGESADLIGQEAETILRQLEDGADFGELAREYSQDEKAREGGLWGWINRADIRAELADKAFALQPGEWSEPIELDGLVFILYAEDKREAGVKPLEEVRDEIEESITAQLSRQAQQRWLERLREGAYIKYYLRDAI